MNSKSIDSQLLLTKTR